MTRRPSIDTISTYQTRYYRYGYASQNGSLYSCSAGSHERIDMYGDERLHSTVRLSTCSYSLGRAHVLSDPSLRQRSTGHSSPRHVHGNSELINRWLGSVSRGTIRPYSQDLSDLQESFERELYVNKRTLTTSPSYLTQPPMISDLSTQWQLS